MSSHHPPRNGTPAAARVTKEYAMPTSQNGWSASPDLARRSLVVHGVEFVGGIRDDDDVAAVLGYVLGQFHERVEPLCNPGCWGFSYRENRNDPNSLSNHSSGTAVDANAPAHPNGVPTARTFTAAQITEVHRILAEVDHAVRWGGDYTITPDSMHFEINTDPATLHGVAQRLQEGDMAQYDQLLHQIAADAAAAREDAAAGRAASEKGVRLAEGLRKRALAQTTRLRKRLDQVLAAGQATKADLEDISAQLADVEAAVSADEGD